VVTRRGFGPRKQARTPDRGEVLMLQFDPVQPGETPGDHPALVLSPRDYNALGLAIVCGMASDERRNPFAVYVAPNLKCGIDGFVHCDQVRLVNWRARNPRPRGRLPDEVVKEVAGMLRDLIDPA
jgi:mRNA-degrading endonuclease toxin of MazEF toxin-antitoxin module